MTVTTVTKVSSPRKKHSAANLVRQSLWEDLRWKTDQPIAHRGRLWHGSGVLDRSGSMKFDVAADVGRGDVVEVVRMTSPPG